MFLVFLLLPLLCLLLGLSACALLSGRGLRRDPWRKRAGALAAALLLLPVVAWHGLAALDQGVNGSEGIFDDDERIRGSWRLAAVGIGGGVRTPPSSPPREGV